MGGARTVEVLTLHEIMKTLRIRPYRKNFMFIIKLCGPSFLFPPINIPPSWHAGQSVHVTSHVCMHWVATLSFSQRNPVW